jgi:cytochrome c
MAKKAVLFLILFLTLNCLASTKEGAILVEKLNCLACHDFSQKRTGPSFAEIAKKYGTSSKAVEKVARIIINPPSFMPPFKIPITQAKEIAKYILEEGSKYNNNQKNSVYDEYIDLDMQSH